MSEYITKPPSGPAPPVIAAASAVPAGRRTRIESAAPASAAPASAGDGGSQPAADGPPVQRVASGDATGAAGGAPPPSGDRVQRLFGLPAGYAGGPGAAIQRRAAGPATADPDAALAHTAGSTGAPLPAKLQAQFGASLGSDLSSVRVHTGPGSVAAADGLGARAFAVGQDIHFAADRYRPDDASGVHLLAHEVAHTVQQGGSGPRAKREVSEPGDTAEVEADRAADAMVAGAPAPIGHAGGAGGAIQRDPDPASEAARVQKLESDYQQAVQASDWQRAAELLNAFNREDILARLGKLHRGSCAALHVGARDNPRVGPNSQAALLTRSYFLDINFDNECKLGHWEAAAGFLDAFNEADILSHVRRLDAAQRGSLKAAAAAYKRVVAAIDTVASSPAAAQPAQAQPAQAQPGQAAAASGGFQGIIAKATQGPEGVEGEQAWVLDGALWMSLLQTIPGAQRNLGGIPIGGMKGWLHAKAKPVLVAKFGSKPNGANSTGLLTYHGEYLLWRHAIHHNHNPNGGPENTGTYDAMEGYKLTAEVVAKFDAKNQPKPKDGSGAKDP
jgi:hypothetical protein